MLSKCANPRCSKCFLYLRDGKLFRLEAPVESEPGVAGNGKTSFTAPLRHEYFWLCEACSRKLQVVLEPGTGVRTIPLRHFKAAS